jgi:hypothetical protein
MNSLTLSEWLTPSNFIAGAALIVAITAVIVSMSLHDRSARELAALLVPGIDVRASNSDEPAWWRCTITLRTREPYEIEITEVCCKSPHTSKLAPASTQSPHLPALDRQAQLLSVENWVVPQSGLEPGEIQRDLFVQRLADYQGQLKLNFKGIAHDNLQSTFEIEALSNPIMP